MGKIITRKELLFYLGISALLLLLALCIPWSNYQWDYIAAQPLVLLGKGIRVLGGWSTACAYIVYISISLIPLVYPAICAIRGKKLYVRYAVWAVLSALLFFILYYAINPHKLRFMFGDALTAAALQGFQNITFFGLTLTVIALVALGLLSEFYARQKKDGKVIYSYARALFTIVIVGVLVNVFFFSVSELKTRIADILPASEESLLPAAAINIFMPVALFIFNFAPAIFSTILFQYSKSFIADMKTDMFALKNIPKLNRIIKLCAYTVFFSLSEMITVNILQFALSGRLVNIIYDLAVPFGIIIAACLTIIFAKILIKAIEVNEENKLVI